jgi:hypothetical protein
MHGTGAATAQNERPMTANRGAYGLALQGVDLPRWTVAAGEGWPVLDVVIERVDETPVRSGLWRHRATLPLSTGGRVLLERRPLRARFRSPGPLAVDDLVHPHLAVAAAGVSVWLGRDPFHAGVLDSPGGAWVVAGRSEAGKSTLLAALAATGVPVLCDDLAVMEDGDVFAGPRSVDLRPGAAEALAAVEPEGAAPARRHTRRRIPLPPTPARRPVAGWIDLEWGPEVELLRLTDPGERLSRLARRRTFQGRLPVGDTLFDLVERPGWVLRRPRDFARLDAVVDAVRDLVEVTATVS